jgi:toxin ParE1/3/4
VKVQVLPAARNDILRQIEYYREDVDAASVADRFLGAVEAACEQLRQMPRMGAPKDFHHSSLAELRAWPVPDFTDIRIYYIAGNSTLRIIRVLHGKRDLERIIATGKE